MRRYERTRDDLVARLLVIEEQIGEGRRKAVADVRARLQRATFLLAVVGEFSSGKSFLLNALLEKFGLLAVDINPTTATITELEAGSSDEATAIFEDGRRERIPLDALNRFTTGTENNGPTRVIVKTDSPLLRRGFVLADTPGLASIDPAHRRATLQFLPTADAVLYLIDTQQPFSEGDASFLGIIRQHIDSIFIVQTKIDLWQQPQGDGRPAWEAAYERIAALAAVHAPGTYVYALSAREYVDGKLEHDEAKIEASRFPKFLQALDASLIRRTGRARLQRARDHVASAVDGARSQIEHDLAMLALDRDALDQRRAQVQPALQRLDEDARRRGDALLQSGIATRASIHQRGAQLAGDLERALAQAIDTADISRLRDRERLNIIVDRVVAHVVEEFAHDAAGRVGDQIDITVKGAETILPLRFAANDAAARAFGAEPGTSLWTGEVRHAVAATIVLEAIGGPAIGLVHDIATRFRDRQAGSYMKRELTADLRTEIFPRFTTDVQAFADRIGARLQRIYDELTQAIAIAVLERRDADLGSVDRALTARREGRVPALRTELETRAAALSRELETVRRIVDGFMEYEEEIAPADPGSETVRRSHADASFDRDRYGGGLRPSRWRVAVLGALRRGKTSLINAFAETNVLNDDVAGSARFPIHVRYGERNAAFTLVADGDWSEIPFESATAAAEHAPVLVLVPWSLPRELVLVHAPAFDSGEPDAEDVNVVVASHASEVLALFSRQLSDRELNLYERIAQFNKPMLFAHTIADNEAPSERRHVVELAQTYLRERNIAVERIFVVSALEYNAARRMHRAPAGWNETAALRATLEAHAESHMARLERLARAAVVSATPAERPPNFFARMFGKGR
ncbi:MAG TPA: dynamin family protein [Candidatus Baltobacteraceae bacterium]|nr:dynamin family protein [Candidatus Baltobacteraceae bacterium]